MNRKNRIQFEYDFFMANYKDPLFWEYARNRAKCLDNYDLIYIGTNIGNGYPRWDIYPDFLKNYRDSYRWISRLKTEYPHLRIAVKHHGGYVPDGGELQLTKNIEYIPQWLDSYITIFEKTKHRVTYGSSMILEAIDNGYPCYQLNPEGNNLWFSPYGTLNKEWQMRSYEDLKALFV